MARELVSRTARCKRCGSETVTWQQGTSGKWYLSEVFDYDGIQKTDHKDFHSHYCNDPLLHDEEQLEIESDFAQQQQDREQAIEQAGAETAQFFLTLHATCKNDPSRARVMLENREHTVRHEKQNWISMDYFTESCRQQDLVKRLEAEIKFMGAALGCTGEWTGDGWQHDGHTCPIHED
jgi:hypothetical protein